MTGLFTVLETLGVVACRMHPPRLPALVALLDGLDTGLAETHWAEPALARAAEHAVQACAGLRGALTADNPMLAALRAMRHYQRAMEAMADAGYFWGASGFERDTLPPAPETGVFHFENAKTERGGWSVYVPPNLTGAAPVVMALHGGSGHGRMFLWNWVPEARARGLIVVAPTSGEGTWSLMEPEADSARLAAILAQVQDRWAVDPARMMLTGMSDGGTFTLVSGLAPESPFTHLAPVAASFHPFLLMMTGPERLTGLPIHITHGRLDWMFPVDMARTAHRTLTAAGAAVQYEEIADLSHAYPRDRLGDVVAWLLGGR